MIFGVASLRQRQTLAFTYALLAVECNAKVPVQQQASFTLRLFSQTKYVYTEHDTRSWQVYRLLVANEILQALHRAYSETTPHFDFSQVNEINVAPPPETGRPAGVSSSAIKDPKLRAKYEEAIAANYPRADQLVQQRQIRKMLES